MVCVCGWVGELLIWAFEKGVKEEEEEEGGEKGFQIFSTTSDGKTMIKKDGPTLDCRRSFFYFFF